MIRLQDLQLPPAFCLPYDAPLRLAVEAAYEREFDQLPLAYTHLSNYSFPMDSVKAQRLGLTEVAVES